MTPILQIGIAFLLDLALGDPPNWPHPVRWIGWAIRTLEAVLRRTRLPLGVAGFLLAALITGGVGGIAALARLLPPGLSDIVSIYLLYTALATRSLGTESLAVLTAGDLESRRKSLARIVSRDTDTMDDHKIRTSLIETIAENSVDGVYAPLFYMILGSVFGCAVEAAMIYKSASTLDSMVGYKNERYRDFGRCSARLDDVLNYLPARLSMPFVWLFGAAMRLTGSPMHPRSALPIFCRDRRKHESPNSALPISMFAGLLGVQVGGPTVYAGLLKPKAYYGDSLRAVDDATVRLAILLMQGTAVLILTTAVVIRWLVSG